MLFTRWLRSLNQVFRSPRKSRLAFRQLKRPHKRAHQILGVPEVLEDRTLLTARLFHSDPLDSALVDEGNQDEDLPTWGSGQSNEPPFDAVVDLPGLHLVDPSANRFDGQVIYLDFDGAEDVVYNGPITIGPFDVPAFQVPAKLAGEEHAIIASVLNTLENTFVGCGLTFTLAAR